MKKMIGKVLAFVFLLAVTNVNAQINLEKVVNRTVKKAERSVENRVENRIDNGVDKSLDAVEDGIDDAVKGDETKSTGTKTEAKTKGKNPAGNQSGASKTEAKTQSKTVVNQDSVKPAPVLEWAKYDFVPGTEIIFEDDFKGEKNGEFPSRWVRAIAAAHRHACSPPQPWNAPEASVPRKRPAALAA